MQRINLLNNLRKFKLITFDVTDTLLQFSTPPAIQYAKTAAEFGFDGIDAVNLERNFPIQFKLMSKKYPNFGCHANGMSWRDWWRRLVIEIFKNSSTNMTEEDLLKVANKLIAQYESAECWIEIDGAIECLKKIKECGKIVGVISNFDPRLPKILENLKIPQFDFVVTSYDAKVLKPDLRIFDQVLTNCKTEIHPHEALHIGNSFALDYLGAVNAGWHAIHISEKLQDFLLITENKIRKDFIYKNLKEFLTKLETEEILWEKKSS